MLEIPCSGSSRRTCSVLISRAVATFYHSGLPGTQNSPKRFERVEVLSLLEFPTWLGFRAYVVSKGYHRAATALPPGNLVVQFFAKLYGWANTSARGFGMT